MFKHAEFEAAVCRLWDGGNDERSLAVCTNIQSLPGCCSFAKLAQLRFCFVDGVNFLRHALNLPNQLGLVKSDQVNKTLLHIKQKYAKLSLQKKPKLSSCIP